MANSRLNSRNRLFIRLGNDGIAIANSAVWRNQIPRDQGTWLDITNSVLGCCGTPPNSDGQFILFRNITSAANIVRISFSGYNWVGTLANGNYLIVPLPYDFAETITITVDTPTGRTLTTSTIQGTGVINPIGAISSTTATTTVTSTPGAQYLVYLS